MDNAAKALEMAAGVLLGVMLFALVAYFFTSISGLPDEEEDLLSAEQLALFNQEYEVYNKKQMYGVDVISCLNKVKSYDDKYVNGGALMSGSAYGKKYVINVLVSIKSPLKESVEMSVYTTREDTKQKEITQVYDDHGSLNSVYNKVKSFNTDHSIKYGTVFADTFKHLEELDAGSVAYTNLNKNSILIIYPNSDVSNPEGLVPKNPDTENYLTTGETTYNSLIKESTLVSNDPLSYNKPLNSLLQLSGDYMRQVKQNTNDETLEGWATVTWNTALYDFKKRMFKCDGVDYNTETGRIKEIRFSEK